LLVLRLRLLLLRFVSRRGFMPAMSRRGYMYESAWSLAAMREAASTLLRAVGIWRGAPGRKEGKSGGNLEGATPDVEDAAAAAEPVGIIGCAAAAFKLGAGRPRRAASCDSFAIPTPIDPARFDERRSGDVCCESAWWCDGGMAKRAGSVDIRAPSALSASPPGSELEITGEVEM
jgi:hypothetical protein